MIKTVISLLLIPMMSLAHPHVFADVALDIKVDNNQVDTIKIAWHYDEMTSQILLMDYDKNGDGTFDTKESQFFKEQVFDTLKQYEYYTHIKVNRHKTPLNLTNFFLSFENNKFVVNYALSLKKVPQSNAIEIGFWDTEFYSSFDIASKFVTFNGTKLKFEIEEVEDDIYMGVVLKLKL